MESTTCTQRAKPFITTPQRWTHFSITRPPPAASCPLASSHQTTNTAAFMVHRTSWPPQRTLRHLRSRRPPPPPLPHSSAPILKSKHIVCSLLWCWRSMIKQLGRSLALRVAAAAGAPRASAACCSSGARRWFAGAAKEDPSWISPIEPEVGWDSIRGV